MAALSNILIKWRWPIIIGFILLSVGMGMQVRKAEIDPDMKSHLPEHMLSRVNTEKIDDLFGGTEMLVVLIETDDVLKPSTLVRVRLLSKKIARVKGVDKVMSLFDLKSIRSEHGAMMVDPAVRYIPLNDDEREQIRDEVKANDMVYGTVVSKDFNLTAIIAILKLGVSDTEMVQKINEVIEDNPGPERTMIGGLPFVRANVGEYIRADINRLLPFGLLIMLIFLYVCFRQLRGVLLPFAVVVMAIMFTMGLIPTIGWKIQIITVIAPIFLIAVANDYGIHLIARYQEENLPGNTYTPEELAKSIFNTLGRPVLLTGLTTMAGMLCLMGHVIVSARQLAVLASIGIVYALTASLFFIPAVISLLPKPKPVLQARDEPHKRGLLEKLLWFFGRTVPRYPRTIIAGALILAVAAGTGLFLIKVDTDPNGYFPDNHHVVKASKIIDEQLGGSQNISIVLKGDIKEPRIVNKMDSLESWLGTMDEVGNTTSIARVVKQMSRALNDEAEPGYDKIPNTRNGVAQYFELYAMSGDAEDFEKMVDFPYEHALVSARLTTASTARLKDVVTSVEQKVADDDDVLLTGGFGIVLSDLAKLVVNGQILSLILATVVVSLLLMILFRSVTAGLISAIPLLLSMTVLFGLMGYFRIELNIATAMLSSIMIGVGVDYTIHFLWRTREERRNGLSMREAVKTTLTTTGRGIVFNAFSVIIGFTAILFSGFLPVKFFGFLVVVSIFACLIGAMVLVPALCVIMKPRFLEPLKN